MSLHEELFLCLGPNREALLNRALSNLDEKERNVIFLRFWMPHSILEISEVLKMTWSGTDQLIEATLKKLKQTILELEKGALKP